jgi:hypothetical protein
MPDSATGNSSISRTPAPGIPDAAPADGRSRQEHGVVPMTARERGQAIMKKLATITVVAVLVVVAMAGPSAAQERAGSGRQGGEGLLAASRRDHGHGGHHHNHHPHQRHVIHGPVIHWSYPAYVPPTSYVVPVGGYWYYCPSAQAYYPHVTNCLETWVAVPAR